MKVGYYDVHPKRDYDPDAIAEIARGSPAVGVLACVLETRQNNGCF